MAMEGFKNALNIFLRKRVDLGPSPTLGYIYDATPHSNYIYMRLVKWLSKVT